MSESAAEWSLRTWKERHEKGYFPKSEEHEDWKVYDSVIPWLLERVSRDDSCLEIGCGYAQWMIPLSRIVKKVVGIDIHPEPIKKGRELVKERFIRNVRLFVSEGTQIPYPDQCRGSLSPLTLIYSISVFQHLPRSMVQGYLNECVRVLRPGGRVLHHFRNADNVGPFPPLAKDIEVDHTGDFSCGWTREEIHCASLKAGLSAIEVIDDGLFLVLSARV